jgi:hypothetical protein
MTETYTFSRALHMMRYGGKKMKCDWWLPCEYCIVEHGELWKYDGNKAYDSLNAEDIMGSWIEVKDA